MANHNGVYYSNSSGLNLRTNATTRINISTGGVIQFNSAYTFPTSDGSANTVLLTNGSGALSFGTVPNAGLTNSSITINGTAVSLGGSITVGDITSVVAGSGLTGGGTSGAVTLNVGAGTGITVAADTVGLDYSGTNNFIDSATNLEGTAIASTDTIIYHDATDNNVKKGLVSDLPFSNNSGTVTSVAISGTDGIDVDSGSPITSSGTITLGLSNIPNSALSNSSVTVGSTSISLGSTSTTLAGLSSVTSTAFVGDLTGDVNGNASTADSWAVSRTLTLGTDLSGSATFNGGSNFTLNASIVSGAVGPTELASNAVITTKISDGNVTNAKLANSTITFNAPTGSDPVVSLGGSFNLISSNGTVSISGNSTTDTIDFVVDNSVNTYVTGGTFSSGTLTLGLNDGTSASSVGGFWTSIPNSALANSSITINGSAISLGGSINVGDITGVTAGNGLTGGGTTGTVTLNVGAGTGITVAADTVGLDYLGADNFIKSATNSASTPIDNDDFIVYSDGATGNVHYGYVNDLPFSNNAGTVTSVNLTAGALIDVSGGPITSSGSITVAVDLSELTDMTATMVGTDEFVVLDASAQRRKAANEIGLSIFNNDAGFTTNTGTVTSVAISGTDGIDVDSGSPITSSGTITLGLSNVPNSSLANSSITINGSAVALGGSISVGDITAVTAGNGLTGGGTSGSVTLNVGAAVGGGISVGVDDISLDTSNTRNVDHSSVSISAGSGLSGGGTIAANRTISMDYAGADNYILAAGAGTGDILTSWHIPVSNASNNVLYYDVLALPFSNNSGTVTSVAISGTDGIDVDSGSPITSSGTITLGLSNVPNSSLANDSITIAGNLTALGGSVTGDDIITNVSAGQINNSQLQNSTITINGNPISLGGIVNVGDINGVTAGTGLTGGGTSGTVTVSLDYAGTDNFIDSATNLEGTGIALSDTIVYHDATDNNVKKGLVSDLPFTNSSGTVTSVAISGTDGIDVDSGSPITTSGTITLGLSNVPNSSLANSAVTVTAGNGLVNGGSVSLGGSVTLNVGAGTGISVAADTVGLDTSNTRNVDHASVSISAGTGLSGGGTIAATRTISLDYAGTDNFIDSATNLEGTAISTSDTIVYHDATDNNVKKGLVSDLPFSNNSGTVTSVGITAGSLIDVTGGPITTSGNITVNVDLSELTTSTTDGDGDYFAVIDTSNAQRKLTKANINLSGFNDNISLYRANGTLTGDRLVSQNNNNLDISAASTERFQVYSSLVTPRSLPRVRFEAIAPYSAVVELESSDPATFIIDGYSAGGAPVFSVDGLGNLVATSKAFDIPHPNPEKREQGERLKHGNLEGPEHGVYVRGRQIDDKEIELPEYWRDLVDPDSITVQLTSVGSHQNLYVKKIEDNVVYIGNGNLFSNKIDCYYFIQAERKDIDKIQVEYTR